MSHLTGNPQLPLSKLAAELSFDGAHWSPIQVTALGNGTYRLGLRVPPASAAHRFGSLRIAAADPAGSTLSQTITHAFAIAGA